MLEIMVYVKKTEESRNWTIIWPPAGNIHPKKQWKYIHRNEQQLPRGTQSNPEVSSYSKPWLCQEIQTSFGNEDNMTPEVLYILKHNKNTLPEINNYFSDVLGHHAQNQGYIKKTVNS